MRHVALLALLLGGLAATAEAQCQPVRRALVVGINTYEAGADRKPATRVDKLIVSRVTIQGSGKRDFFPNLTGAVNDALRFAALLRSQYHFDEKNVELLVEEKATAQNILDKFETRLIGESSCPGDISVFFYSGHGSEIRNIARPENSTDAFDQTIVPYDATDGVADIRDKELTRLYLEAARKSIWLTVIADSCHSGGLSRGLIGASRAKDAPRDPRYVKDEGITEDPTSSKSGVPHPVLVMAAAFEKEEAKEDSTGDQPQGAFTKALLEKLRDHPENQAIGAVFSDVKAAVATRHPEQHSQIFGDGRQDRDMFGGQANTVKGMVARIKRFNNDNTFLLDRGSVSGIYADCTLRSESKASPDLRLRIRNASLAESVAEVESGSSDSVQPGDRFRIERWVVPQADSLVVYYDKNGPTLDDLTKAAAGLAKLEAAGIRLVPDPSAETPKYQIGWVKGNWQLHTGGSPAIKNLGPALDPAAIAKLIPAGSTLSVNFPLPAASASKLKLGAGTDNSAIRVQTDENGPDYALVGQWNGKALSWAWVRPGTVDEDQQVMNLPVRTDWFSPGSDGFEQSLEDMTIKLNRVKGWMSLGGPPGGNPEEGVFPYRVSLRKVGSSEALREKDSHTVKGEKYKVWLTATQREIAAAKNRGEIPQRWVYVLAIDREGTIDVVIPAGSGNVGNHVPDQGMSPEELQLTAMAYDFSVGPPFGLDTYILLLSEEPIDPNLLPASGVVSKSGTRGNSSPLANLLANVGNSRSRGIDKPLAVPATWSVQRLTFRSTEK